MQRYTIKEIARMAGVSPSAVSIVLNNRKGVGEETRKKVIEIVNQMNYVPNPNSRRLISNRSNNIAILLKKDTTLMEFFFYSDLNRFVLHECEANGYNVIFASYTVKNEKVNLPNIIRSYDVDGAIFYDDIEDEVASSMRKYNIPFIVADDHANNDRIPAIHFDYRKAAAKATDYLISLGHTQTAYIGSSAETPFGAQTLAGFKDSVETNHLNVPLNWVQFMQGSESSILLCVDKILSFGTPTALLCSTDMYAIDAMKILKTKGFRIPEDISVIGIDDIMLSSYIEPALTTVKVDRAKMGVATVHALIKKINGETVSESVFSAGELIIRKSTRSLL